MIRNGNRQADQLREISFEINYTKWAEGSVLAQFGDTKVLCNVTVEDRVPRWLHQSKETHGWLSAEYGMLPRSCLNRTDREQRWPSGRTQEISRLLGRTLRMGLDLQALGQRHLIVDCDVIQADAGTRTAAISGAWVAIGLALQPLIKRCTISPKVFKQQIAAVSAGLIDGELLLDLDYEEDSKALADVNIVMNQDKKLIEIQGTGEKGSFTRKQLNELLDLAENGLEKIFALQLEAVRKGMPI